MQRDRNVSYRTRILRYRQEVFGSVRSDRHPAACGRVVERDVGQATRASRETARRAGKRPRPLQRARIGYDSGEDSAA